MNSNLRPGLRTRRVRHVDFETRWLAKPHGPIKRQRFRAERTHQGKCTKARQYQPKLHTGCALRIRLLVSGHRKP
jgi:hypothetical protein